MRLVLAALGLVSLVVTAIAGDECSLSQAAGNAVSRSIDKSATLARQNIKLLENLSVIVSKAQSPDKPLMWQLSASDLAKFTELKQRIALIETQSAIESGFQRDIGVIQKLFVAADAFYGGAQAPPENNEYFVPAAYLISMRELAIQQKWGMTEPIENGCTIETSLDRVEKARFGKVNDAVVVGATKQLEAIKLRSQNGNLSEADRATVERLMRDVVNPSLKERDFIRDLENLKGLWKATELKYEISRRALMESGGDGGAIIDALNEKMKAGGQDAVYLSVMDKLAQKFPSEHSKMMEQTAKAAKKSK
jgi:hypothetical protein